MRSPKSKSSKLKSQKSKSSKSLKSQALNLKQNFELSLTPAPPQKRPRMGKKAIWPSEKVKGSTKGLQLNLWPYKGEQLTIDYREEEEV